MDHLRSSMATRPSGRTNGLSIGNERRVRDAIINSSDDDEALDRAIEIGKEEIRQKRSHFHNFRRRANVRGAYGGGNDDDDDDDDDDDHDVGLQNDDKKSMETKGVEKRHLDNAKFFNQIDREQKKFEHSKSFLGDHSAKR